MLDPNQAAVTGHVLGASTVVPMHYGGYEVPPYYHEAPQALGRFEEVADQYSYERITLEPAQPHPL